MKANKIYTIKPFKVGQREIHPITSLTVQKNSLFLNINFQVVAIRIVEKEKTYYKNISLSEEEFEKIKNRVV